MAGSINVVHWGLGAMGGGIARLVQTRPGLISHGAIDADPGKAGLDLGEAAVMGRRLGVPVYQEPGPALEGGDVCLIATSSLVEEVFPQIEAALEAGLDVICLAEEMAFPWASHHDLAEEIDALAKRKRCTVLGTGINPGFVLDTLIIALTGVCSQVRRIRAARINDLSPFGPTVMRAQGVGTSPEEFRRGLAGGVIVGHIGFPESIRLIARALGWEIDRIEQEREPIVSKTHRQTAYLKVEPGMVAGCRQTARAYVKGQEVISLEHPQQILPEVEGVQTGDFIWIEGEPDISVSIRPEIPGGKGTIAIAVNMIPAVLEARPGLLTMADLPVPRALIGELSPEAPESARPGDWVMIHRIVLPPGERAPSVPEETRVVPLEMFVRGLCQAPVAVGEECLIVTLSGRRVIGRLKEIFPRYPHDFGRLVPELLNVGPELRLRLRGEPGGSDGGARSG